jgi:hypothetical protein
LDKLVDEIRLLPGFGNFQKPLSERELMEAASAGPIVIINVSPFQCDAILISRNLPERNPGVAPRRSPSLRNPKENQ